MSHYTPGQMPANRRLTTQATGSTSYQIAPSNIRSGSIPQSSARTAINPRGLASQTRRLANTNISGSIVESRASSHRTVTGRDRGGEALTTFRNVREVEASRSVFVNTPGPVHFFQDGVPSRQPPVNDGSFTAESTYMHPTHGLSPSDHSSNFVPPESEHSGYEIYQKYLLVKKRGTPLWEPGPQIRSPTAYRRNGVSIGDVGVLDPTGNFIFLFNIFLPADHEINNGRVPDGFIPLDKSKVEKTMTKSIVRDRCLASSSLRRTNSSDFAFQSTGREGAVLVMPDGGISEELQNYKLVEKYVAANAKSWWEYVESDDCGMQTENGLQVVVGTDKVSSWGMATFENVEEPMLFEFNGGGTASNWKGINGRAGPEEEEIEDLLTGPTTSPLRNQCVFVRTLNVSVWAKGRDKLAVRQVCSSCFRDCMSDSSRHQPQSRQRRVDIQRPQIGTVQHPSKLLNKYLLEQFPNAEVVITRDLDWISIITENDTTMPSAEDVCARILDSHIIHEEKGVITLKKREKIASPTSSSSMNTVTVHQQDELLVRNEDGAHEIGHLFLETPDDQSMTEPSGTLYDKDRSPACFDNPNPSGDDNSGTDVHGRTGEPFCQLSVSDDDLDPHRTTHDHMVGSSIRPNAISMVKPMCEDNTSRLPCESPTMHLRSGSRQSLWQHGLVHTHFHHPSLYTPEEQERLLPGNKPFMTR